jgi:hypothetical protein
MNEIVIDEQNIKNKIYTIRGMQVILDRDLAEFYGVKPIRLREQVKRNIKRFPDDFMFQLKEEEIEIMVSQNAIPSKQHLGGAKPYVFTEQGVSMLSAVLKTEFAVNMSIIIIRAFVNMKRFLLSNASIFQRLDNIEYKLLKHDENFDKVFKAIESKDIKPIQGIFYDGQIYDAYVFVNDLLKSAKKEVTLIDNYIDDSILTLFSKYPDIGFTIITKSISEQLKLDIKKYNSQYNNLTIKTSNKFHDRFLIIDNKETYHVGASLKDLGKKVFGFSKIDVKLLQKIINVKDMRGK